MSISKQSSLDAVVKGFPILSTLGGLLSTDMKTFTSDSDGRLYFTLDKTNTDTETGTVAVGAGAVTTTLNTPDYTAHTKYTPAAVRLTFSAAPNRSIYIAIQDSSGNLYILEGSSSVTTLFLNFETCIELGALMQTGDSLVVVFGAGVAVTMTYEIIYDDIAD